MSITESAPGLTGGMKFVTSIACVATIIDVTMKVMSSVNGEGIQLLNTEGKTMSSEELREAVTRHVYQSLAKRPVTHSKGDNNVQ